MTNDTLWRLGAADIAGRIAARDISATDAVSASIGRMHAVNGRLNAVVDDCAEDAMAEAARLDETMAKSGPVGPLHGVPITIKVNVDQAGRATTNGVTALKDMIAPDDAPIVSALRRAGAVVIGRTNTPEFSFRADTDNPLHGRTKNPWDDRLSPGGSSGGAASAVMAGIGALGHGNDIGGSLRFPAAACGAATVKPGLGRVAAWNPSQKAERGMLAQAMSVQGVIAREVKDVRLAMTRLVEPDARDPFHVPLPFEGPPHEGPIRVGFTKETFGFDLHPDVEAALDAARDALADAGYKVEEVAPPMARQEGIDAYRALLGEVKALMGPDIRAHGSKTVNDIFDRYHEHFPPFEGDELLAAMAARSHLARKWSLFLERHPLMLTPFLPTPTYRADRDTEGLEGVIEVLGAGIWSYAMNFIGQPAGNIPAYFNGESPVSVQIIGRRWREDLILDACESVEARVGVMAKRLFARED